MKKSLVLTLVLVLALSLVFTGCGPKEPAGNGEEQGSADLKILRSNNVFEPGSLDPALAEGTHESWVLDHVFEGLMKIDQDMQVVPGMAESYEVSDDFLTYTFTLRDGITWTNGDPVTAEDFEFTFKRALDPDLAADYAFQLYYIKGAEAYNTSEGSVDDVAVKALDEKTLEIVLESPVGYFLELTAFFTYYPVNKSVVEENPDWAKNAETHVSNGPFELVEWSHDANISLRKNENYYDADSVKLDGIDLAIINDENTAWQAYEGGDFDFLTEVPQAVVAQLIEENNPELVIGKMVGTYYYNVNSKVKPFNNAKVRKGMSMCLDRQTIVDKISQGGEIAAEGVVPFGMFDEDGEEYRNKVGNLVEYNPEEGKKLFEEGLAEEGMTADDFSQFAILYNTLEAHKKIAQAAQEMWRKNLGIEVQLENVDFQVKLDREKAGDYEISRGGWIGDYMDPMSFIDLWYSTGSFNDVKFNDPVYDGYVNTAKGTAEQDIRFEAMRAAEKLIMDEMAVIPVYFYTQPYAQKPYVTGVYKPLVNYPKLTYADMTK